MIVVTIHERTLGAARRRLAGLTRGAGMVELRLDDLADQDWPVLLKETTLPVLATCRGRLSGGRFDGSEEARVAVLRRALQAGAARVDLEVDTPAEDLIQEWPGDRLVLSHHEFRPGTTGLEERLARLLSSPGEIVVKLAFMARRTSDALLARKWLRRTRADGRAAVILPMGEEGVPARILAPSWGAAWTYAAPDGAAPAALGQLPLSQMAGLYDVDNIGPDAILTGILGCPVGASLSPWMHNRGLRDLGIAGCYLPFATTDAADLLLNAAAWGLHGLSVTHPHKEVVLPWVDDLSDAARGCGAVNTLTFAGGGIHGENTDGDAACQALEEALPHDWHWPGRRVAIVGAGGASRAVGWALRRRQAVVTLYSRDAAQGEQTAAAIGALRQDLKNLGDDAKEILIHATPVGTWPNEDVCLLGPRDLDADLVFDLVSNPRETLLLRRAASQGCSTLSGLSMLVRQGEAQFRLWHGQKPSPGCFMAAALEGLRYQGGE
ncbi:MAG: type I 3-dehydroquinate dehydratase [Acidobacteria bacterium]|nr:type I 3-dehydroquinate dehydratase [Acidobacteriota bacterium]